MNRESVDIELVAPPQRNHNRNGNAQLQIEEDKEAMNQSASGTGKQFDGENGKSSGARRGDGSHLIESGFARNA